MGKGSPGHVLQSCLIVHDQIPVILGILVHLGFQHAIDVAIAALALGSAHDQHIVIVLFNESGIELELCVFGLGHTGGDGAFQLRLGHFLPDGTQGGFYLHTQDFIQVGIGVGVHHQDGAVLLFAEVVNNHAAGGGLAYPTLTGDCDGMRCCHKCCAPYRRCRKPGGQTAP